MLYGRLMGVVTGALGSGPPAYQSEIWLASALLSVTFPFLIFYAEFLRVLAPEKSADADAAGPCYGRCGKVSLGQFG